MASKLRYLGKHALLVNLHSELVDPVYDPSVVKKVDPLSRVDLATLIATETTHRQSLQRQSTSSLGTKQRLV